ncbi:HNH endonuclease [Nocardioides panacisoli]|uniref:HNH endonuclease signature motif containing protein n=1 Tax=Nocardioides panacisoli TaxID=627624 RepID=UPI001C638D22|nr:HNH endonuclease signature motif containing protein [Nocardioides panacisoli]QYJ02533.1 HNH endonuclease [Nocardioides panacisoli]
MSPSTAPASSAAEVADAAVRLARSAAEIEAGDLPAAAADVARARAALDAVLVTLADRLEDTGAAQDLGWAGAKELLTHVTGGHKGAGGGLVRTARQTRELPEVRSALSAGDISLAQARVIGNRVATLPRDPEFRATAASTMLDRVAQHGYDATDLDRAMPGVVAELDPDGRLLGGERDKELTERGAHRARHLAFSADGLGGVRIRGYATAEEAELVKTALMPLAAPRPTDSGACGGEPGTIGQRDREGRRVGRNCPDPTCAHDGRDPRDAGVRLWDALVEAAGRLVAADSVPQTHGTAARVVVTMRYDDLREQLAATSTCRGEGRLAGGDSLSVGAVRRLACDAEILPAVLGSRGQVLDVGRTQRLVTTAIWHALVLRDQHCAFPGCTRLPIACDAHHVVHWADGGATSLANLVLLCRAHHTVVHETPWQIRIDPSSHRPVWIPPPRVDDSGRFTYLPPRAPPPTYAA